jgi:hypothetical protein
MKTGSVVGDNRAIDEQHEHPTYDPIVSATRESPKVDFLWLKNGESQTLLQKVGFTILSLFWFAGGLFTATWCVAEWRDGDLFWCLFSGCIAGFFLMFGALGLRNVLRFKE